MNAKNLILGLSVAAIGLSSCCNTSTKTNVSLKNEADTASFYIGYMYGSNITGNGIEEINMDAIIAGMNSALQKKERSCRHDANEYVFTEIHSKSHDG